MFKWIKRYINKRTTSTEKNSIFKLINVSGSLKDKNIMITYQVRGKVTSITESPGKLVDDLMILKGFTKEDSEVIYSLAASEKEAARYRIVSILFAETGSCLAIEDIATKMNLKINVDEIFDHHEFLANLDLNSTISALSLYYSELMHKQNEKIKKISNHHPFLRIIK